MDEREQLAALSRVLGLFEQDGIESWLFGGWAVDFHVGSVTRPHADLDLAVWASDLPRIAARLTGDGWSHAPEQHEDGYTGYEREGVRLELAFLARRDDGRVCTPLRDGFASWPANAFGDELAELSGIRARVIGLDALREEKATVHDDPVVAANDRADSSSLHGVRFSSLAPQLAVRNGRAAVTFYEQALGARVVFRHGGTDDEPSIVAQLAIGAATFWVADESPENGTFSPESLGGGTVRMLLTVADPDAVVARALANGATELSPVEDAYGWRVGRIADPYGHHWEIGRPDGPWPPPQT